MQVEQTGLFEKLKEIGPDGVGVERGISRYIEQEKKEEIGKTSTGSQFVKAIKNKELFSGNGTYQKPGMGEEKETLSEGLSSALGVSAKDRKNEMAVLSHIMTPEDYGKLQENGFSFLETDSHTIITETDKIKAVLAKAGVQLEGYTNDLNMTQLEEITGNSAVARQIVSVLEQSDLPVTEENLLQVEDAWNQVCELQEMTDASYSYMIENKLEPTISNLYTAQYSSMQKMYQSERVQEQDMGNFDAQIQKIIVESGLEVCDTTMEQGQWLLKNQLPVTGENLLRLQNLQESNLQIKGLMQLPELQDGAVQIKELIAGQRGQNEFVLKMGNDSFAQDMINPVIAASETVQTEMVRPEIVQLLQQMADAIAQGKPAKNALLGTEESLLAQAQELETVVAIATEEDIAFCLYQGKPITLRELKWAIGQRESAEYQGAVEQSAAYLNKKQPEDAKNEVFGQLVSQKRFLEETRLMMTAEANYALLKRGISVDTQPLAEVVEDLKKLEDQLCKECLQNNQVEASDEHVQIFKETKRYVEEIKQQPVYALHFESAQQTLPQIHEEGAKLQAELKKANASYETMMTVPDKAYGDSIQKAFRNVDDILSSLGMEITEGNQRAVRILSYNQIELTPEHIRQMRAVDQEIQRTFQELTPQVTLELIRRDINPLDLTIAELNENIRVIESEIGYQEVERFSKFLYKLEQNKEISEEERSAYIGIYRLIAQVEKSDGAAIGSLVYADRELTMRNLLQAVRSAKKENKEYVIDDEFDGISSVSENKIDQQIEIAFQQRCVEEVHGRMAPERLSLLSQEQLQEMTPEQLKEYLTKDSDEQWEEEMEQVYAKEMLSYQKEVKEAGELPYTLLNRYHFTNSIVNVLAASRMIKDPNEMFQRMWKGRNTKTVENLKNQVLERFGESLKNPKELADAQETLADVAEHVMEDMIIEDPDVRYLDIKEMRLACRQFRICAEQAKEENYMIPVQMPDGNVTGVSLKIVHGKEKKGRVDIFFESGRMGHVSVSLSMKNQRVTGTVLSEGTQEMEQLQKQMDRFTARAAEDGLQVELHLAQVNETSMQQYYLRSMQEGWKQETEEIENPTDTKDLYLLAEKFIQSLQSV